MIPFQVALALYVPVAAFLMADRNNARGFSIAMLAGLMVLPAGKAITLSRIPDLDKFVVSALGILMGTLIFHPHILTRFRPRWFDVFLPIMMLAGVVTSVKNGLGAYDGFSLAFKTTVTFLLPLFLARVHLGTPQGLKTFLLVLVAASVIYTPLLLWEWRMSPQLHRMVYGYFQHDFVQFRRWGFFRPVVCFRHALDLGRFYAFSAFVAAFPLREEVKRRIPFGNFAFLVPLFGLLLTMSLGPYMLFGTLAATYFVIRRWYWTGYIVPAAAVVWAVLLIMGLRPLYGAADFVRALSPDRAQSLQYRLNALETYRANIMSQPIWGHGRFGRGRISKIATDSTLLVRSLSDGLLGTGLFFAWWLCAMHAGLRLAHKTRGTPFHALAVGGAILPPVAIAVSMIDAALDPQVEMVISALIGTDTLIRSVRVVPRKAHVLRSEAANRSAPVSPVSGRSRRKRHTAPARDAEIR